MNIDIVVLNGGSSSGKTSIARELQAMLRRPYLCFGVDSLIEAMPPGLVEDPAGIVFGADGTVVPGPEFRRLEQAWYTGLVATARAGAGIILDEVFLGGRTSQQRVRDFLDGVQVLWVGVRCATKVAAAREAGRPDRIPGMAAAQAESVHLGVDYDLTVDTTRRTARQCASSVAEQVG